MLPGIKRLRKKWPDKWALIALFKTPSGTAIEIETDFPRGEKFLEEIAAYIKKTTEKAKR